MTTKLTPEQIGLRLAAGVTIAFGLAMALAGILIWPMDGVQPDSAPELRLTFATTGDVMVGWG